MCRSRNRPAERGLGRPFCARARHPHGRHGCKGQLPSPPNAGVNRTLYFFRSKALTLGTRCLPPNVGARVRSDASLTLVNGVAEGEVPVVQGRPIGEPVVQRGPFVMNDEREIQQAFADCRRTGFGGWPWKRDDPVHRRDEGRFAIRRRSQRTRDVAVSSSSWRARRAALSARDGGARLRGRRSVRATRG